MKVVDLLPKLVKNEEYQIMISDEDNRNIITFNPSGHIGISAELNDRDVKEIIIADSVKAIKVFLEAVSNNEPTDPTDPTDPSNP